LGRSCERGLAHPAHHADDAIGPEGAADLEVGRVELSQICSTERGWVRWVRIASFSGASVTPRSLASQSFIRSNFAASPPTARSMRVQESMRRMPSRIRSGVLMLSLIASFVSPPSSSR